MLGGKLRLEYRKDGLAAVPDNKKPGSYEIYASGASVPSTENYESEIIYSFGTLTVNAIPVIITPPSDDAPSANDVLQKVDYRDVSESDWFYKAVDYCTAKSYFNGVGDKIFAPSSTMIRAMFVMVLYRIAGEPPVEGDNPFKDVENGKWYTDPVVWASSNGIIRGYGNGKFGTDDLITREQIIVLLWRYNNKPDRRRL